MGTTSGRQQQIYSAFAKKRGLRGRPGPAAQDDWVKRKFAAESANTLWLSDIATRDREQLSAAPDLAMAFKRQPAQAHPMAAPTQCHWTSQSKRLPMERGPWPPAESQRGASGIIRLPVVNGGDPQLIQVPAGPPGSARLSASCGAGQR